MKSERRHELQTNDLAVWLKSRVEEIKPYAGHIAIGALVLVVLIAVFSFLANRTGGSPAAWTEYYEALGTPERDQRISELRRVAEDKAYSGTVAGLWARLSLGEARLQRGSAATFKDRNAGKEDVEAALEDFQTVVDNLSNVSATDTDLLQRRALYGLAQAEEVLGNPDAAMKNYAKIAEYWPESVLGKSAIKKTETLADMSSWYQWYASAELPKPSSRFQPPGGLGSGGAPPQPPQLFDDLPETGSEFTLPGPLDGPGTSTDGDATTSFEELNGLTVPATGEPTTPAEPADDSALTEPDDDTTDSQPAAPETTEPADATDPADSPAPTEPAETESSPEPTESTDEGEAPEGPALTDPEGDEPADATEPSAVEDATEEASEEN